MVAKIKPQPEITSLSSSTNAPDSMTQTPMKEKAAIPAAKPVASRKSPVITFDPDIEIFNENYHLEMVIGKGAFGKVYSATRKSDCKNVAVKQMLLSKIKNWTTDSNTNCLIPTEVALLHRCQAAENVIRLIEYFQSKTHALIVMERNTEFIDLFDLVALSPKQKLSHADARHVVYQITKTLAKCQLLGVIHRDLKKENVLVHKKNGNIKLLDFGLAQLVRNRNQKFTAFKGTAAYKPPEHVKAKEAFADSLTVWSIGCFAYSLLFGSVPFKSDHEIVAGIINKKDELSTLSCDIRDFIRKCLHPNPESRPLLQDLVHHSWISSPSVPYAKLTKGSSIPRCSYKVLELWEQPITSVSSVSSRNSNVENYESSDSCISVKFRKNITM